MERAEKKWVRASRLRQCSRMSAPLLNYRDRGQPARHRLRQDRVARRSRSRFPLLLRHIVMRSRSRSALSGTSADHERLLLNGRDSSRQLNRINREAGSPPGSKKHRLQPRLPETNAGKLDKIHEVVAMVEQPCSKASNETPSDNATIGLCGSHRRLNDETDIITGRNKKVQPESLS